VGDDVGGLADCDVGDWSTETEGGLIGGVVFGLVRELVGTPKGGDVGGLVGGSTIVQTDRKTLSPAQEIGK
jgi:hypothetical protein